MLEATEAARLAELAAAAREYVGAYKAWERNRWSSDYATLLGWREVIRGQLAQAPPASDDPFTDLGGEG